MQAIRRRIGPVGTVSRVAAALVFIYLAALGGDLSWGLHWYEAVLGVVVFPAVTLAFGLSANRLARRPLHFTGPVPIALNCAVIALLLLNPYTGGGAALFYGLTLLVAAWRTMPDCEVTVLSNWILKRNDQVGCPILSPIDEVEARLTERRSQGGGGTPGQAEG